ncbi:MAG TPA: cupin domain-containing protein [Stellaceae bacterium]|jgi:quercetin dioxygenase-like cupin family protein|nr:cupin domain-containing protein [Stellaceae bacterium]
MLKLLGEDRQVELVRRDDVPSMRTIVVNGVEHWLGHVKDFTKNTNLAEFLPKDNRISMAWVRLEAGEELTPHVHPVPSMILIVEGSAKTTGDKHAVMNAGDALLVPQRRPHGFIGMAPNGFWGLSIQFDSRGLYEDIEDPWATFLAQEKSSETAGNQVEQLFKKNEEYMERFDKHRLFVLVRNGMLKDPVARRKFLDCFQVWSNYFQKMVLNRVVTLQNPAFDELAWAHLLEEIGHNRDLAKSRPDLQPVFDPILEGVCSWFASKVGMISDIEKVVLVHLVVEASAVFFYQHVQPAMGTNQAKGHFDKHKSDDEAHVAMGYDFLRNVTSADWPRLFEIQRQGWAMLMSVMGRVADLVVHTSGQLDTNDEQPQQVAEPIAARAKSSDPFLVEPVAASAKNGAARRLSEERPLAHVVEEGTAAE